MTSQQMTSHQITFHQMTIHQMPFHQITIHQMIFCQTTFHQMPFCQVKPLTDALIVNHKKQLVSIFKIKESQVLSEKC